MALRGRTVATWFCFFAGPVVLEAVRDKSSDVFHEAGTIKTSAGEGFLENGGSPVETVQIGGATVEFYETYSTAVVDHFPVRKIGISFIKHADGMAAAECGVWTKLVHGFVRKPTELTEKEKAEEKIAPVAKDSEDLDDIIKGTYNMEKAMDDLDEARTNAFESTATDERTGKAQGLRFKPGGAVNTMLAHGCSWEVNGEYAPLDLDADLVGWPALETSMNAFAEYFLQRAVDAYDLQKGPLASVFGQFGDVQHMVANMIARMRNSCNKAKKDFQETIDKYITKAKSISKLLTFPKLYRNCKANATEAKPCKMRNLSDADLEKIRVSNKVRADQVYSAILDMAITEEKCKLSDDALLRFQTEAAAVMKKALASNLVKVLFMGPKAEAAIFRKSMKLQLESPGKWSGTGRLLGTVDYNLDEAIATPNTIPAPKFAAGAVWEYRLPVKYHTTLAVFSKVLVAAYLPKGSPFFWHYGHELKWLVVDIDPNAKTAFSHEDALAAALDTPVVSFTPYLKKLRNERLEEYKARPAAKPKELKENTASVYERMYQMLKYGMPDLDVDQGEDIKPLFDEMINYMRNEMQVFAKYEYDKVAEAIQMQMQ